MISRYLDPRTGHVIVVAGGLSGYGTEAAGRFLTDPAALESLARQAPAGWDRKNMQAVIRTPVLEGAAGPPQLLATYFPGRYRLGLLERAAMATITFTRTCRW